MNSKPDSTRRIYGNLTIEDLERDDYVSSIRNKLLAESFYLMGDIEKYGTGFIRIRKMLTDYPGVSYSITETGDFFKVEMRHTPTKTPIKTPTKTPMKAEDQDVYLTGLEDKIFKQIQTDNHITFENIATNLSISRNTVIEYVNKLKSKGVLKRVGSRRGGHWEIIGS
ncbi:MAG: winged helix-turn-helix transcriptional regulator [Desulfobacteraceae bacterium]|nr:winged helix-turn-helix transcriptional regulator [Desulfobacteraceae bacterium]